MAKPVELNSGNCQPQLGFGTWLSKPGEVERAVVCALKVGFRHVDCANVYGNEKEVKVGLEEAWASGVRREDVFITSKLWNTFHKKADVIPALKRSLADLGLTYLDQYLIHWPMGYDNSGDEKLMFPRHPNNDVIFDQSSFLESWGELEKAVDQGLTKSIGVSNFSQEQVQSILDICRIKPAVNQVECHPYNNQAKLLEFLTKNGIKMTAYSPFGNPGRPWKGTAKDGKNNEVPSVLSHPAIVQIAQKHSKGAGHVLLRYQLQRGIICLTKSVTPSRIASNYDVFDFELDAVDMEQINGLDQNLRMCPLQWDNIPNHKDYPFKAEFQ